MNEVSHGNVFGESKLAFLIKLWELGGTDSGCSARVRLSTVIAAGGAALVAGGALDAAAAGAAGGAPGSAPHPRVRPAVVHAIPIAASGAVARSS